ncbi:MAG: hypothetical protein H7336_06535 [Bacteriovorax sp.]|nr:hypothetical protein [Bacteriovorax sp.]
MQKSYMKQLLDIATFRPEEIPENPEALKKGIKIGLLFLILFIISIVGYKLFLPHIALFLISFALSIIGISAFFINLLAMYYFKHGLKTAYLRFKIDSREKMIFYILTMIIFTTAIFLPIIIKIYL